MNILIAEDDDNLRNGIAELLRLEGHECTSVGDGDQALASFISQVPDFCVLDVMMPGLDGFELCRRIRQQNAQVPILFLSAKDEEIDHVVGLELGADDFVVKPFQPRELVARIRAIARRRVLGEGQRSYQGPERGDAKATENPFFMDDLEVDARSLRASRPGLIVALSRRELKILQLLKRRAGEVVTKQALYDACWGRDYLPSSRALDQQMLVLRRKIERDPGNPRLITTIHGEGYRYEEGSRSMLRDQR